MIVLAGADLVLPDRIVAAGTVVIDAGRIAEIRAGGASIPAATVVDLRGHVIVPGFVDVHVHGIAGIDSLDAGEPIAAIAARLPQYGVTAFCPTTVACPPEALGRVLDQVRRLRAAPVAGGARVLPAHLESNFLNPDYNGAQPARCLRSPRAALAGGGDASGEFDAASVLREIERAGPDVAIVTLAPELDGGIELVEWLAARGHRVSLGHSGATYDQALTAIAAGARHATHLFNRMPPLTHRAPGLVGAVLQAREVAAEVICDGVHVHPAVIRTTIAAKHPSRVCAITDATAGAGLPRGARTTLGGQPITVGESAALLDDGRLAGSTATMDHAFRLLVEAVGVSLVDAATLCATTPARELGLAGRGVLASGAIADLVVLDRRLAVVRTYVGGELAYSRA